MAKLNTKSRICAGASEAHSEKRVLFGQSFRSGIVHLDISIRALVYQRLGIVHGSPTTTGDYNEWLRSCESYHCTGHVSIECAYNAILWITSAMSIAGGIVKSASSAMAHGVATMDYFGPEDPSFYF